MLAAIVVTLVCGAVLGLRFRVHVLFPVMLLLALVIAIAGYGFDRGVQSTAILLAVSLLALQTGYLLGLATRAQAAGKRTAAQGEGGATSRSTTSARRPA